MQSDRRQLRNVNETMVQMVNELEATNREHSELREHLRDAEHQAVLSARASVRSEE